MRARVGEDVASALQEEKSEASDRKRLWMRERMAFSTMSVAGRTRKKAAATVSAASTKRHHAIMVMQGLRFGQSGHLAHKPGMCHCFRGSDLLVAWHSFQRDPISLTRSSVIGWIFELI